MQKRLTILRSQNNNSLCPEATAGIYSNKIKICFYFSVIRSLCVCTIIVPCILIGAQLFAVKLWFEYIAAAVALLIEYNLVAFMLIAYVCPSHNISRPIVGANVSARIVCFHRTHLNVWRWEKWLLFSISFWFVREERKKRRESEANRNVRNESNIRNTNCEYSTYFSHRSLLRAKWKRQRPATTTQLVHFWASSDIKYALLCAFEMFPNDLPNARNNVQLNRFHGGEETAIAVWHSNWEIPIHYQVTCVTVTNGGNILRSMSNFIFCYRYRPNSFDCGHSNTLRSLAR